MIFPLISFFARLVVTSNFLFFLFFFNDTATTEIYTLPLHDALPIPTETANPVRVRIRARTAAAAVTGSSRSEEHTSELQSQSKVVCRLLLDKKKRPHPGRPVRRRDQRPRTPQAATPGD